MTILCHCYIVPVVGIEKHDKRSRLVIQVVVAVVGGGGNLWLHRPWRLARFFEQVD